MKIDTYIKLKNFFKQMLFLLFPIFIFSVFLIGIPILTNHYSVKRINIDYAEMQITGKHYDSGLKIIEGKQVISGDCYISLGELCSKYHYKSIFGKNNQIVMIDDSYSIVLYSEITDENGNNFLIDNVKNKDKIVEKFISRKRSIVNILAYSCLFLLAGFCFISFFIKSKQNI